MNRFDVAVVGAGMVGAAAALALARKGFSVALIERQAVADAAQTLPDEFDLRVSAISPASQQLLDELGVWAEIRQQRSCAYHNMVVWHERGDTVMHFASEQVGRTHLGSIVENRLIQLALQKQLRLLANVAVFDLQHLLDITRSQDSVSLSTSAELNIEAQLLIAADGRASAVRELCHLPAVSGSYRQSAIVANVSTEKPHGNTAWQRFLSSGPLAFLPLSNGQSSIVWSADTARAEELMQLPDEDFMLELAQAFEHRLGAVTAISKRAVFPLSWHSAEHWLKERVLLIGDAAHGVHPLAGQGVNLGFGDVALLAQKIPTGGSVYQYNKLRQLERQRKAEAVTAMHLFTALKQLYGSQNGLVCKARDIGMSMVESNTLIKRLVIGSAMHNMS